VFSGDVIKERRVRDLAKKIVLRPQPGLSKGWGGTMSIQLQNGKRLGGELNSFLGSPDTPFDADGLKVKFDKLVQDEAQGLKSSLFGELMRLELIGDVNDLTLA
jgi:2-methylcitrate dehydratase PrpD